MTISERFLHSLNVLLEIIALSGSSTDISDVQLSNAPEPIDISDCGNLICSSDEQKTNAESSIFATPSFNITFFKLLHSLNVPFLIAVTLPGTCTETSPLHL